jgi:alkylation response protein AidB-like acyl-CoA dehydrogenase
MTLTFDDLLEIAREYGRDADPHVRQKLAKLATTTRLGVWNAQRGKAEAARGGGQAVAQTGKITQTTIMKLSAEIALDILGAGGTLATPDGPQGGRFSHAQVFSAASSIYGGTDEIQRNIIGERILGLPREPNPDKDLAYGEVLRKVNPAAR